MNSGTAAPILPQNIHSTTTSTPTSNSEAHHNVLTSASLHEKMQNGSKTDSETNHSTATSASQKGSPRQPVFSWREANHNTSTSASLNEKMQKREQNRQRNQPQHRHVRFAAWQVSIFGVFCAAMLLLSLQEGIHELHNVL